MEKNLEDKIELQDKIIKYYNSYKKIILILTSFFIILAASFIIIQFKNEKKNDLIAEMYIEANLYLASKNKEKSKLLYEEIILSKNDFYSILALNSILENDLILDKNKILKYFKIIKKLNNSKDLDDLLTFKKALYLIKFSNYEDGSALLEKLIKDKSKYKNLAEEIIVK